MSVNEPYVISRVKSEKVISYVTPQGKGVRVTREVYLRKNLPCRIDCCSIKECHSGNSISVSNFVFEDFVCLQILKIL